jgi:hypothetical protein
MSRTRRIAELETQLSDQGVVVAEAVAHYRGIEAELESMRAGATLEGDLVKMPRTEAILAILRQSEGTLSPSEIAMRLRAAGRDDDSRSVTATLSYMVEKGRIEKVARGLYLAV